MGLCADLIGFGPYKESIIDHLEYDIDCYSGTKEDTIISVALFGIYEGTSLSREFALCLGITDTWDFNQHKLNPTIIDKDRVKEFGRKYADYAEDSESLLILMENKFEFYFRPNG